MESKDINSHQDINDKRENSFRILKTYLVVSGDENVRILEKWKECSRISGLIEGYVSIKTFSLTNGVESNSVLKDNKKTFYFKNN